MRWSSRLRWSTSKQRLPIRQLTHADHAPDGYRYPVRLFCPDWTDPRNVGSAFRLADAAGLAGIVLAGTTPTPPHPKIAKTSRSTERAVPWEYYPEPTAYLRDSATSFRLALELTDESVDLVNDVLRLPDREILLIAGNESAGLSDELLAHCDAAAALPMHGQNSSMNVAMALGAAVYLLLAKLGRA